VKKGLDSGKHYLLVSTIKVETRPRDPKTCIYFVLFHFVLNCLIYYYPFGLTLSCNGPYMSHFFLYCPSVTSC